jgi:phospho-N-acetylmuramoyl-pentapeptide-transferase
MLYYLYEYLHSHGIHIPGLNLLKYISFRAGMAIITSLIITLIYGQNIIKMLRKKQMGEQVRDLGLEGQKEKEGTPTMGGLIIIGGTLLPVLLFAKLDNIYILLLTLSMLAMGALGFLDDYLKKVKKNKDGLSGKFKIIGQVVVGLLVGATIYFNDNVTIRRNYENQTAIERSNPSKNFAPASNEVVSTVPFVKNNEFSYSKILFWLDDETADEWSWLVYIPCIIFIVTAVSNGANITDGIDGLAAGTSVIILLVLALFAYLSGNMIFADYLNIMFLPNMGETSIFVIALVGAVIGFFWYNTYPAQVFMGDTGSLMLGGVIAVLAVILRKELLLPILCGVFVVENFSVVLQVAYFKYTKKKYGEGRRIFLMSPLHHHYQKKNYHESKIVNRFLILGILLAVICLITLKLR